MLAWEERGDHNLFQEEENEDDHRQEEAADKTGAGHSAQQVACHISRSLQGVVVPELPSTHGKSPEGEDHSAGHSQLLAQVEAEDRIDHVPEQEGHADSHHIHVPWQVEVDSLYSPAKEVCDIHAGEEVGSHNAHHGEVDNEMEDSPLWAHSAEDNHAEFCQLAGPQDILESGHFSASSALKT